MKIVNLNDSRIRAFSKCCALAVLLIALLVAFPQSLSAQERWFQIEVSIFTNESLSDRAEETWQPGRAELQYPDRLQRLNRLQDILFVEALAPQSLVSEEDQREESDAERTARLLAEQLAEQIAAIGPLPAKPASDFKFFDFARDSFLQLPASQSDFQQTNRALERSPDHRLLFHGLWRQAVENTPQALPLYVSGGEKFGEFSELEGSLTIRFNDNRDRVVIDTNLWLTEFSTLALEGADWELPAPPGLTTSSATNDANLEGANYYPIQVYHMQQSREMRSTEFHYLDNPALGVVVMVEPYELPVLGPSGFDTNSTELPAAADSSVTQ
ncbi:MAG: peptidoglycan binding protein CsiV [Pseudomonadales bacterium]|nr:peptidoglycan binding protein CsiV [Pseudomonadales bacterium]